MPWLHNSVVADINLAAQRSVAMSQKKWDQVDHFLEDRLLPHDEILEAALQASNEAGLPAISVTATQGRFLNLLARVRGARRILEIGTLGGYSTIWLARALPADGSLVTLELDSNCSTVARTNFERAGLADLIDLREGPALDSLPQLAAEGGAPFDLVFLDADKEHHPDYFQWALKLSRPGTLIVADNVVRDGAILDPATEDPSLQGIRELFDLLYSDSRVEATALQTVGSKGYDGFAMALVVEECREG